MGRHRIHKLLLIVGQRIDLFSSLAPSVVLFHNFLAGSLSQNGAIERGHIVELAIGSEETVRPKLARRTHVDQLGDPGSGHKDVDPLVRLGAPLLAAFGIHAGRLHPACCIF